MSELLMAVGAIVCGCGILLSLLYVLTFTLNIVLNKNLPFYKDLFQWVKHRRKFKEWLIKENRNDTRI